MGQCVIILEGMYVYFLFYFIFYVVLFFQNYTFIHLKRGAANIQPKG